MPSILITGGSGFIGSHIVEECVQQQYNCIRILDDLSSGNIHNIDSFLSLPNVEYFKGSITNLNLCRRLMKGMTMVCHQAAKISVPESIDNPFQTHHHNVSGFMNLLLAAKEQNVKRIVYASSSAVYGDNTDSSKVESAIGDALSPYAVTKRIDELYAKVFTNCYGMEIIGLRYFNVYGPRQNPNGPYAAVISKFTQQLLDKNPVIIYGDGSYSRDFVYVKDIVRANMRALETTNPQCFGSVYNIGTGESCTILELYEILQTIINQSPILPIFKKNRLGDIPHSCADISKAEQELNYLPSYCLQDGLANYLESITKKSITKNN